MLNWGNYLWLIWMLTSLSFLRFYIYVIGYRKKIIGKPMKRRFRTPEIIFQITTKGNIPIVQETVDRVNEVCQRIEYNKYEIWVVTDAKEEFRCCRTIRVPGDYSCNAIFKGRALQYAVEIRKSEGKNDVRTYLYHLDDESLVTEQTICSILSFLEDNPAPISEGLIVYPLAKNDAMKLANFFDTIRPFCCFECVSFMSRGNPAYVHGSNLLVRSDVEEQVGWNNGKTIAEDSLFAIKARQKLGSNLFGWHGGVLEEKSPHNVRDIVTQRKRWFYGLIQNLKYLDLKDRVLQVIRALLWASGFVSGIVSIFSFFIYQDILFGLRIFFLIACILWLLSYQVGAYLNSKKLSRLKRLKFHLITLFLSPIVGLFECSIPILSLFRKPRTFELVEK